MEKLEVQICRCTGQGLKSYALFPSDFKFVDSSFYSVTEIGPSTMTFSLGIFIKTYFLQHQVTVLQLRK